MRDFLLYNFTTLFVVIDPIGTAALFATLTPGMMARARFHMALRACLLSTGILFVFAFGGEQVLSSLGITLAAFRIGGGILLFLLSVEMVFARHTGLRGVTEREDEETTARSDLSVFPLAFPLIAGPGAITTVILLMGRAGSDPAAIGVVLVCIVAVMALALGLLMSAPRVMTLLGVTGANVIGRLLGVLLAALAIQFILDGLGDALSGRLADAERTSSPLFFGPLFFGLPLPEAG